MNTPWEEDGLDAALRRAMRARPEPAFREGVEALAQRAAELGAAQARQEAHLLARWLARRRAFNIAAAVAATLLLGAVVVLGGSRVSSLIASMSLNSDSSSSSSSTVSTETDSQITTSSTPGTPGSSSSQSQETLLLLAGLGIAAVSVWGIERALAGGAGAFGGFEMPSLR